MEKAPSSCPQARTWSAASTRAAVFASAFALVTALAAPEAAQAQAPGASAPAAPVDCSPKDGLNFVCGVFAAEDIVATPDRRWLIGSSLKRDKDGLYVIDAKNRTAKPAALSAAPGAGGGPYAGCPAPDFKAMNTHGIELRAGKNDVHTVYAINQENRESVEVFSLDARGAEPKLQWVGCVMMPEDMDPNGVVAMPGGAFAVTKFRGTRDKDQYGRMLQGEVSGTVYLWTPGKGFSEIPGTQFAGDNGIVVSPDGKTLYIAEYGTKRITRVSVDGKAKPLSVTTAYRPDNLRWDTNGKILVGGQFMDDGKPLGLHGWEVDSLDPKTMAVTKIIQREGKPYFDNATTGIRAGGVLWIGSYMGDRIAYVPAP